MAKSGTTSGQAELWSDLPQWWHLVAKSGTTLGQADLWADVPPVEASTGQEWYYFRSGGSLV